MQIQLLSISDVRAITDPTERVCGEIKLSLQYHRGALTVMVCDYLVLIVINFFIFTNISLFQVHHARSLPATPNGQEPNTYVKVYLTPDKMKLTKRKTKVVRKTCFPSFMETVSATFPISPYRGCDKHSCLSAGVSNAVGCHPVSLIAGDRVVTRFIAGK